MERVVEEKTVCTNNEQISLLWGEHQFDDFAKNLAAQLVRRGGCRSQSEKGQLLVEPIRGEHISRKGFHGEKERRILRRIYLGPAHTLQNIPLRWQDHLAPPPPLPRRAGNSA